jgi:putative tryptophan/tyrosine transport system substrate-binding protein
VRRRAFLMMIAATAARPLAAQQTGTIPTVAWLSWWAPTERPAVETFLKAMRELGWIDGSNIRVEFHWADGNPQRAAAMAAELARCDVNVIVAQATPAAHAAKEATRTVPIVILVADPLATGLVPSLAQPGGNVTGLATMGTEITPKRVQLLREILPEASRLAFLGSTNDPNTQTFLREAQAAVDKAGLTLQPVLIARPEEFEAALSSMTRAGVQALLVQPIWISHAATLAALALKHRLPIAADQRDFVEAGGLLAYGQDRGANTRRAAAYVDRILKGAKPDTLPVELPTEFHLAVNLRTARTLGITVPQPLLLRADEVIE